MTNGEKIIAILKPRKDQIRIYSNWIEIEIQKLGINFSCELDWWNIKCNEPSNKSIIYKAKESKEIQEDLDKLRKLNEPTTKNDLAVDCIDRVELLKAMNTYDKFGNDSNERLIFLSTPALQDRYVPYVHYDEMVNCVKGMPSVTLQESILDKIRAEIEETYMNITYQENKDRKATWGLRKALQILDKYKAESENT